jgi:hypothetical protein
VNDGASTTDKARSLVRSTSQEALREGATMALYVSIVLLAEMITIWVNETPGGADPIHGLELVSLIWGTTIGLAVAHLFAFRLAAGGFGDRTFGTAEWEMAGAQLGGAASVALVCSVPVMLAGDANDLATAIYAPDIIIGVAGYIVSRAAGRSQFTSVLVGIGAALLGVAVAAAKNILAGH